MGMCIQKYFLKEDIVRETEKAYLIGITTSFDCSGGRCHGGGEKLFTQCWIPKSKSSIVGEQLQYESWLHSKLVEQMIEFVNTKDQQYSSPFLPNEIVTKNNLVSKRSSGRWDGSGIYGETDPWGAGAEAFY